MSKLQLTIQLPRPSRFIDAKKLLAACEAEGVDPRTALRLAAGEDVRGRAALRALRALEKAAKRTPSDPELNQV